ncbi:MAG TPA: hypothetical protein VGW57_03705 [Chthoniobacterales bacterium]|nr:hypothetical protein [Chthoniobacterales bacterium]
MLVRGHFERAHDFRLERFLQDLVEHRVVLVHVSGKHPAERGRARDVVFVVEGFFRIGDRERAIVDGTDLQGFVLFAGGRVFDFNGEGDV